MSVHPYRQKMTSSTPYPVTELEQITQITPIAKQTQTPKPNPKSQPSGRPLDESLQLNRNMLASPRFNVGPLASTDSFNTNDIPDITQQLSRSKISSQYAEKNLSVSSIPQDSQSQSSHQSGSQNGRHQRKISGSHNSSVNSIPYGQNGHSRSFSSTSSMFLDRVDGGVGLDLNQNVLQQHLGPNSSHLMPRMKTIELYRKNAKKSSDPAVLFQYAQYMLQTAILFEHSSSTSESSDAAGSTGSTSSSEKAGSPSKASRSASSLALIHPPTESEIELRESLLKESLHYLKRLSDKGYVDAQYFLGDAYSSGVFGKVENKEAFNLFLSAAKHGHCECAFRTAHCYEEGLGTGRDARKGVEFLKMAASKNHPAAMYKLGVYFFHGRMGVSDNAVNKKLGIKWLERASNVATELTSAAPFELGKLYQSGYSDILIKDEKYALELFSQAAALGHVEASAILGHHYEVGHIVAADPNLSIHYYTKSALGGHAQSMLAMCAWYMVGSEPYLPRDEQEAFEWAKRAASCGHGKAQFVLANFLDKGIGCSKDAVEAQKWYEKAAENGQDKALARITDSKKASAITKKLKKAKKYVPSSSGTTIEAQEKDCVIM